MVIEVVSAGAADLGDMLWYYSDWDDLAQEATALMNYITADYLNLAAVPPFRFKSDGITG
jgi:DNA-binding transcriptional regulator YbjK